MSRSRDGAQTRLWSAFLVPPTAWLLVFFALALCLVLAVSFGTTDDLGNPLYGTTLDNYHSVFGGLYLDVMLRTLLYAAITVALCLLVGYPAAYTIALYGGRWRHLLIAAIVLPLFTNYLVRTYAWTALLSDDGFVASALRTLGIADHVSVLNTPYAVVGGLTYGYIAFMILPVYAALDRMDPSVIEAGRDLYGSPWQTFRHVTWPSTSHGVMAGGLLVFLPAVGDFVSAQFLGGPSTLMIGNLIQRQFTEGANWPVGSALAVLLALMMLVLVVLYTRATRASSV